MIDERIFKVLKSARVTEKSTLLQASGNQYAFDVTLDANKTEIKKAVEKLFGVNVVKVNVVNIKGTKKQFGRTRGMTKKLRKAYVTLASGQSIDVASVQA